MTPYITEEEKEELAPFIQEMLEEIDSVGKGNYVITKIAQHIAGKFYNYASLNSAIGMLECAKLEFYRRLVSVYEDHKRGLNGDVY